MRKKGFICAQCQRHFETNVLESGEAEARRLNAGPVRCPQCGSTALLNPDEVGAYA